MPMNIAQIESIFFSPDPRVAMASRAALLVAGAAVAALLVVVAGPIYGVVAMVALVGGLLMLRDLRWGLVALFAVIGLLPFAALPFKVGFTPTFLDLALMALLLRVDRAPRHAAAARSDRHHPSARWCWGSCCWRSSPLPTACATAGRR